MKRIDILLPYIRDKEVLDIGCVEHSWEFSFRNPDWLHKKLCENAASVVGIDCLGDDVRRLNEKGYSMLQCDAENFDLQRKFDVIVAGELIEHLSNPGNFFESVKKHMRKDSKFIVTTPNAFSAGNIFRVIKLMIGKEVADNVEHVNWYNRQNLCQLAVRHGFNIERSETFYPDRYPAIFDRLPFKQAKSKLLFVLTPNFGSNAQN